MKDEIKEAIKQTDKAQQKFSVQKSDSILDKDKWVMWDDLIEEHKYDNCIMANNAALRREYNDKKRSRTGGATAMTKDRMFRHVAAIPTWLWLRMEIITGDPDFWNDEKNLKIILHLYPEYALVDPKTI